MFVTQVFAVIELLLIGYSFGGGDGGVPVVVVVVVVAVGDDNDVDVAGDVDVVEDVLVCTCIRKLQFVCNSSTTTAHSCWSSC